MSAVNETDAVRFLKAIIAEERKNGCPQAMDALIEPALRRWKSYERRFKTHKDKSLMHRTHDLEKGLLAWYPDFTYDPCCIRHLAISFAEALFHGTDESQSLHAKREN